MLNLQQLLPHLENGLPICSRPYLEIAKSLGATEQEVIDCIANANIEKNIRRFGAVINHHKAGYTSNAMCVWNIPDNLVNIIGKQMIEFDFVTLCYERARSMPQQSFTNWPYNLYCMIHGKNREETLANRKILVQKLNLERFDSQILFSTRKFKQRGAKYTITTEQIQTAILRTLQDGIEITHFPYQKLAASLKISEQEIVDNISEMIKNGKLSRFGPMFNVEKMGGEFTLVAMEVPQERFEAVNDIINSFVEVAHNYERAHQLNMWFVVACNNKEQTKLVLQEIEKKTGLKTYALPKEEEYFLDLRFRV